MKHLSGIAVALAVTTMLSGTATAQTEIKVTHIFGADLWHWVEWGKVLVDEATKNSNGELTFTTFPAGQLGKQTTTVIDTGLATAGIIPPSYEVEAMPLTAVVELPGFHSTSCEGTARFWNAVKEGGVLYESEYKPQGLRPLSVAVMAPYEVMTSRKKVTSLEDLRGLKVRSSGGALTKTLTALGAVPISTTQGEIYDSLQKGTVDGTFQPIGTIVMEGMAELLRFAAEPTMLGGGSLVFVISEDTWQELDAESQKALSDAGMTAQKHLCAFLDEKQKTVREELVAAGKMEITIMPPEEVERWNAIGLPVQDEWAEILNGTGRPGTEVLEAYRAASKQF
ncbi:MAG: TRAP transporter substrate-binding protein DctP [Amaricoccus sp.]|uniref:TRAP transporter substrate-binding protein DctP n=1 Tax=Amaricoccus sp. TaxID=1872485 RepID=UPI0039E50B61